MKVYSVRDFRKVVANKKVLSGKLILTLEHECARHRRRLPWSQLRFSFWRDPDGILLICTKAKGLLYRAVGSRHFQYEDRGEFFWSEFEDMLSRKFDLATKDIPEEYVSEFRRLAKFMKDFENDERPGARRQNPRKSTVVPIRRAA